MEPTQRRRQRVGKSSKKHYGFFKTLVFPKDNQLQKNNDQGHYEHEKRNTVDTMHVFHPFGMWSIRIALA
jgi:hypothetical protein